MSRVKLVGIELEGGWDDIDEFPDGEAVEDLIQTDESLQIIMNSKGVEAKHWGEIISPPLPRERALMWIVDHYPDCIKLAPLNKGDGFGGCGLHIHTSFHSLEDYALLGSWAFYSFFIDAMEAKLKTYGGTERPHIEHRLKGFNKYCTRSLSTFRQVLQINKVVARPHRRTHLNFCYKMHGTIECRLLPMFKKSDHATDWTSYVLDIYEEFLTEKVTRQMRLDLLNGELRIKC